MRFLKLLVACLLVLCSNASKATHIFGGDLLYTHVTGNTYKLTLVLYADCAAKYINNGTSFNALYTASPVVKVMNGNSVFTYLNLTLSSGFPNDVSPVCPAQLGNTLCNNANSLVPGVYRFQYTGNVTLNAVSANWKFLFTGWYGNGGTGRASTLTNIVNTGNGTIMALEATLNNTLGSNNSPTFSTIPTPFYCVNVGQNYNPGCVDPDGDSLNFAMVAGIDSNYTNISYIFPATAAVPVTGTFNFTSTNGQMAFTPSAVQNSLVVNKIFEYKNGVLVGTAMREMTFVVLNTCTNSPPTGTVTALNVGTLDPGNVINICQGTGSLNFSIPAIDPNGDSIILSAAGVPSTASLLINQNGTPFANALFTWSPPGGFNTIGSTTFYITFTDKGCPLSSNQTLAFTIKVVPNPSLVLNVTQPICGVNQFGTINAQGSGGTPPLVYNINNGAYAVNNLFNNLTAGIYTVNVKDSKGCTASTAATINQLPIPVITSIVKTNASCSPGCDATATINATSPSTAALSYSINNGATFQLVGNFAGLCVGTYTVVVKDNLGCSTSSIMNITNPANPSFTNINTGFASCSPGCDGTIISMVGTGGVLPYTYNINSGSWQSSTAFSNLCVGNYTVGIKDVNSCTGTTVISITSPPPPTISSLNTQLASCSPGCDGGVNNIITSSSSATSFTYSINNGPFSSNNSFSNLCVGTYIITVKDNYNCTGTTSVSIITPPGPVIVSLNTVTASCNPGCDGVVQSIIATSPNGGLTYSVNNINFTTNNSIGGLCTGSYTLTAKDASGCISTSTLFISTNPPPTILDVINTPASCIPGCDGTSSITASAFGGINVFYSQLGGVPSNNPVIGGLCVGVYTIVATDAKGCTATSSIEIFKVPDPIWNFAEAINISCNGLVDGKINVGITGNGAVIYTLFPSNIQNTTGSWTNLGAGPYNVVGVDSKGCTLNTFLSIINPDPLSWDKVSSFPKTCDDVNNGIINVKSIGGTGTITYYVNNFLQNQFGSFTNLGDGVYTVTAKDINNCSITTTVTVLPPSNPLKITTTFQSVSCSGVSGDAWAEVSVVAGDGPFNYKWNTDPPQSTPRVENLTSGTLIVTVQDAYGCIKRDTVEFNDPSQCCDKFYFPNAITLNNDELNDKFKPLTVTKISEYNLAIYSRWGEKVWETSNQSDKWDGTKKERELPSDTYYFLLRYKCAPDNKYYTKKGDIIIIK